jgi:hypothetical protein
MRGREECAGITTTAGGTTEMPTATGSVGQVTRSGRDIIPGVRCSPVAETRIARTITAMVPAELMFAIAGYPSCHSTRIWEIAPHRSIRSIGSTMMGHIRRRTAVGRLTQSSHAIDVTTISRRILTRTKYAKIMTSTTARSGAGLLRGSLLSRPSLRGAAVRSAMGRRALLSYREKVACRTGP